MSNKSPEEAKSSYNISKAFSASEKYINPNYKPIIDIEEDNSKKRSILRNAGRELLDSQRYFTTGEESHISPHCQSCISPRHRGIKRRGHPMYDPYLIKVCKKAIILERRELPNYKEIIQKVNTEYGIEDKKKDKNYYYKFYNNSKSINSNSSKFLVKNNSSLTNSNKFNKR